MKKTTCFVVLVAIVVGLIGFPPAIQTQAATDSLATVVPADAFAFVEMQTGDLMSSVTMLEGLLHKANIPSNVVADLDKSLTQALGRPATMEKDVFSWLGDHVAMAVSIPDAAIDSMFTRQQYKGKQPDSYVIANVKDEAGADAFLKDVLASIEKTGAKLTPKSDALGGGPAMVYYDKTGNPVMARWKGYLVVGGPSIAGVLDAVRSKAPTLATTANYKKIVGMLKPNNVVTVYARAPISPPGLIVVLALLGPSIGNIFQNIVSELNKTPGAIPTATPSPTPSPTPPPSVFELARTLRGLGASGMGLYHDTKSLAVDVAFYVSPDNLKQGFSILKVPADVQLGSPAKSITLKMADRMSNKATVAVIGSDMATMVKNALTLTRAGSKLIDIMDGSNGRASAGFDTSYSQVEAGLRAYFDLDLNQDILSWLGSDYAIATTYDPGSDLAKTGSGPFDQALIIDTPDTAKAEAFVTKINAGLGKLTGSSPTAGKNGLYTFTPGAVGPGLSYGLVKNEFILSNTSGAADAVSAAGGDGVLSSDTTWKETTALLPKAYQHVWYANMGKVASMWQEVTARSNVSNGKETGALIDEFKSALLFSTDLGGGSSLTTFTLTLK